MLSRARLTCVFGLVVGIAAAPAVAQTTTDRFVPFREFIRGLATADPAGYLGRPSSQINRIEDFDEMRRHVLSLYDSVQVSHSFVIGSQYFDCVPIAQQPSVRLQGLPGLASPPARLPAPAANRSTPSPQSNQDRSVDQFGNTVGCRRGTIPMRRITLDELSRFRNLRQFLQKGPDGAGQFRKRGAGTVPEVHKYAFADQDVSSFGGSSFLNVWNPAVPKVTRNDFSLSQHWYVAFPGGITQTVEVGWQHYPWKYGARTKSVNFIFWTSDNYKKTGCYNLDCAGFVQINPSIALGSEFDQYSKAGGNQREFQVQYFLYQGNWWLFFGDAPVGYYPGSLWSDAGLALGASSIEYGGETDGTTSWSPMGSGAFAEAGEGQAAYQRSIYYFDSATTAKMAHLKKHERSPSCYTLVLTNQSAGTDGTYFYFGGPGGTSC
jgi:hypothetical protein